MKSKRTETFAGMTTNQSGFFITGCSHSRKTTLAAALSENLGICHLRTDDMARHPGRPWPNAKPTIADYYGSLTVQTTFFLLQAHYENFQPLIATTIAAQRAKGYDFVFEGSAIRPSLLPSSQHDDLKLICLYADNDIIRARIRKNSDWENQDQSVRMLIDRFTARTLTDNAELAKTAKENGFKMVHTDKDGWLESLLATLAPKQGHSG